MPLLKMANESSPHRNHCSFESYGFPIDRTCQRAASGFLRVPSMSLRWRYLRVSLQFLWCVSPLRGSLKVRETSRGILSTSQRRRLALQSAARSTGEEQPKMARVITWIAIGFILFLAIIVLKKLLGFIFRSRSRSRSRTTTTPFHDELADTTEDIASATRVAAVLTGAAAFLLAPAGLLGVGAMLGLVPTPLVVTLAPILVIVATGAAALSAAAKLYASSCRKRLMAQSK